MIIMSLKEQVYAIIDAAHGRGTSLREIREELNLPVPPVSEAIAALETEERIENMGFKKVRDDDKYKENDEYVDRYKRGRKRVVLHWRVK